MGEIADGLINGDFDFYTGEYLGRGYGIPRTRNKSLPWEGKELHKKASNIITSKESAYNGIKKYIVQRWNGRADTPNVRNIIGEFIGEHNFDLKHKCVEVQKDFGAFVKFINTKLKTNRP